MACLHSEGHVSRWEEYQIAGLPLWVVLGGALGVFALTALIVSFLIQG
jgi:hypothetical protein